LWTDTGQGCTSATDVPNLTASVSTDQYATVRAGGTHAPSPRVNDMNARKLLQAAIDDYGSEAKLGEATGYTQNAIHQAKRRGTVTWEMATVLDHVSGGRYPRRELCPEGDLIRKRIAAAVPARKRGAVKHKTNGKARRKGR
jgi:hypothetical protein